MSAFYLHEHPAYSSTDDDGVSTMTPVSVHQDGEWVPGSAFVHLMSTPRGDFAIVHIRAESRPVNAPSRAADFTFDDGGSHYHFASHEAALAFLRHLYGIDAPQPDPEPVDAPESQAAAPEASHVGFELTFTLPREVDGCTFVEVVFEAPSYQEPVTLGGEPRQMTVSGNDLASIYGSDLLGWTVHFGRRITPDLLEGIVVPGVTFRDNTVNGLLAADDFTTLEAAKGFVTYAYERLYEAFYLGFDAYTVAPIPAADTAPEARQPTASPRSVPAPLARNAVRPASPCAPGRSTGPFLPAARPSAPGTTPAGTPCAPSDLTPPAHHLQPRTTP